jgi:hypothetical protein
MWSPDHGLNSSIAIQPMLLPTGRRFKKSKKGTS